MYCTGYITLQYSTILVFVPYSYLFPKQTDSNIKHVMVRYSTRTRESSFISSTVKHNVPEHAASDRSQTTNGEKFVKSGERTYNADGHIQDGPKILTGSNVSPPTHPNTNNLRPYVRLFFDMYVSVRFVPPAARFAKNPGPHQVPPSHKSTLKQGSLSPKNRSKWSSENGRGMSRNDPSNLRI